MSHLPVDARAILHYLNELGYRNISAPQLKEFLKDLRKLIKYEERMGVNTQQNNYFESLFRRTTASYRGKIEKENARETLTRRKSNDHEKPTTSKQAATAATQRVLQRKKHSEGDSKPSSSHYVSYGSLGPYTLEQPPRAKVSGNGKEDTLQISAFIDSGSIKTIIEQILTQVFQKNCLEKTSKDRLNETERRLCSPTAIKSVVEETLTQIQQKRLSDLQKDLSDPGSFKSIIEDIVTQVLTAKLSDLTQTSGGTRDLDNLNQDLQKKLNLSKEKSDRNQHEHQKKLNLSKEKSDGNQNEHHTNRALDTQSLVQELLGHEVPSKSKKYTKSGNENSSTSVVTCFKRLRRSPRKKPEWQNPERSDGGFEKPSSITNHRSSRGRSPTGSSSVRSERSRYSSSVMIPRSTSQGRGHKPNSDPVALYQYYKKEWEHFRGQIPGETMHHRLRWNLRQRMLDRD